MPTKKPPWNPIVTSSEEQVGRLNRQELRRVLLEVKALREAREARARRRARNADSARAV